jgi:hypothetical protein
LSGIRAVALVAIALATSVDGAVPTRVAFAASVAVTLRASVPISVAVCVSIAAGIAVFVGIPVSGAIPLAAVSVAFIPVAVVAPFGRGSRSRECNAQALAEIDLKPDRTG